MSSYQPGVFHNFSPKTVKFTVASTNFNRTDNVGNQIDFELGPQQQVSKYMDNILSFGPYSIFANNGDLEVDNTGNPRDSYEGLTMQLNETGGADVTVSTPSLAAVPGQVSRVGRMSSLQAPLKPLYSAVTPVQPYVVPVPNVVPTASSSAMYNLEEAVGIQPGSYVAPNWVYPCGIGAREQCFTDRSASNPAYVASTIAQSGRAVDSVTRGLLSGLQPLLSPEESTLFNDGDVGVRSVSTYRF